MDTESENKNDNFDNCNDSNNYNTQWESERNLKDHQWSISKALRKMKKHTNSVTQIIIRHDNMDKSTYLTSWLMRQFLSA